MMLYPRTGRSHQPIIANASCLLDMSPNLNLSIVARFGVVPEFDQIGLFWGIDSVGCW